MKELSEYKKNVVENINQELKKGNFFVYAGNKIKFSEALKIGNTEKTENKAVLKLIESMRDYINLSFFYDTLEDEEKIKFYFSSKKLCEYEKNHTQIWNLLFMKRLFLQGEQKKIKILRTTRRTKKKKDLIFS